MFNENLDVFFDTDGFATVAVIDGGELTGIFDVEPVTSDGFVSIEPTFLIKTSDANLVAQGDTIIIDGVPYRVGVINADDDATTKIILHAQS